MGGREGVREGGREEGSSSDLMIWFDQIPDFKTSTPIRRSPIRADPSI